MLIGYDLCVAPWATRPLALAGELVRAGHEVRLLHYPLPKRFATVHSPAVWGLAPVALDKRRPLRAAQQLRTWVDWCDILHVQKPTLANHLFLRLARDRRKPLVCDWDDWEGRGGISDVFYSKTRVWRVSAAERYLARHAATILYANDTIARELARAYRRVERTTFVPCGVDGAVFDPARFDELWRARLRARLGLADGPLVVYHGQLDVDTEQATFLQTVRRLRQDVPVSCLVVGGGVLLERLRRRASDLGLADAVRYAGCVPHHEVPGYLALGHAAVVLLSDALYAQCKSPLKLFEAMAMELPVVGTRIGQVATLLEPDCGVLTNPGHPEEVEAALRRLLADPAAGRAMGVRARRRVVEQYSWRRTAERLCAAYRAVLET